MRRCLFLLVLALGLAVPALAYGEGTPSPAAVAACQAEAAQLGKDAFVAKYGPTEAYGHCYAAHATTTTPPPTTTTTTESPAAAACKAEYLKIGAAAFIAKYGAVESYGHCLSGQTKPAPPTTTSTTPTDDPVAAACKAEYVQLGAAAFSANYGATETYGNCLKAHRTAKPVLKVVPVKAAQAACLAEGAKLGKEKFAAKYGSHEPFGQCVKAAAAKTRR
jgi:hypothetical protein